VSDAAQALLAALTTGKAIELQKDRTVDLGAYQSDFQADWWRRMEAFVRRDERRFLAESLLEES